MSVTQLPAAVAPFVVGVVLLVGVGVALSLDGVLAARVAGRDAGRAWVTPWRRLALVWVQRPTTTERPDALLWRLAPAAYLAMAALVLVPVPLAAGVAVADVRTGIVLVGTAEVGAMVAIYLHGWSSNSYPSLVGGYRIIAMGLSYALLSMFVLIAAALPAESMSIGAIVDSQAGLWNVVRQPLGLPLWLVVALGVTFWGPLDQPDGPDLGGGTAAETSGPHRVVWRLARLAMLVAYAVVGAAVFLGGHHGPLLPGWLWMLGKSVLLLAVLLQARHVLGRIPPERFMLRTWTVLLPLSFLDLLVAGVVTLL